MVRVILTHHAQIRIRERGLSVQDVMNIAKNSRIARENVDGTLMKYGMTSDDARLVIICRLRKDEIVIITAY